MRIRSHLRQFVRTSYVERTDIGKDGFLDCAWGINNFGVSRKVLEFAKEYDWSTVWQLPDPAYQNLKEEIRRFWSDYADLKIYEIKIANGSSHILEKFNKMFIERGAKVLGYAPQFAEYVAEIMAMGGQYRGVTLDPEDNFKFDVDKLLSEITPDYCTVYIDNPNNPTGQLIALSNIEEIVREARRKEVVVLVDEAYGDYVGKKGSAINLMNRYDNLIVTRSFTKAYGLASCRVGYGIFPREISEYYDKIDIPFPVSTISYHLAREALLDQEFIQECGRWVKTEKRKLIDGLRERGFFIEQTYEYCPIFVLEHKNKDADLRQDLRSKGILSLSGTDFMNLGKNYVRINLPFRAEDFLSHLESNNK